MNNIVALIICFISGLSFFVGYLVKKLFNKKKQLVNFSIGFAFVILIGLSFFDLLPECLEAFNKFYLVIIFILIGIVLLKMFDLFIPHHEHSHEHSHIEHISTVTCIALFLHNVIECSLMFITASMDVEAGIFMAAGVMCHNIPLSIEINSLTDNNKKELLMSSSLLISSIIGGFSFSVFNINLSEMLIGILICITFGMIIYIVLFELLCEVKENIKSKSMIYGLLCGLLLTLFVFVI